MHAGIMVRQSLHFHWKMKIRVMPYLSFVSWKTLKQKVDSWESLGQQGDQTSQSYRKSILNIHWKDWCWNSNILASWWEEPTHWKRPWSWERLKAGGEGDDRGWDGWMASLTRWTWVSASSGSWWWTGKPIVLQSMGSQRVRCDWATELNWIENKSTELGRSIHEYYHMPYLNYSCLEHCYPIECSILKKMFYIHPVHTVITSHVFLWISWTVTSATEKLDF